MADTAAQLLLILLLAATIVWCVLVHRRLGRLRTDGGELADIVTALDAASRRAEAVVGELRTVATEASARLAERDGTAQQREAELGRLIETAGRVVRRLEGGITQGVRTLAEARTRVDLDLAPAAAAGRPAPVDRAPSPERRLPDKAEAILEALRGLR